MQICIKKEKPIIRLRMPGDETFCPEAERAALAADERSPRKRKLADVNN